ncbi:telomere-capping, CST complex subunit-domain-containing protein [Phycomyces nitens]|nr:telomere-capping, CST complex subunit-domain-containing protein [Phycomyces nitens]
MSLRSGQIVWIGEIASDPSGHLNSSVRVTGYLDSLDLEAKRATLTHEGHSILLDVSLVESFGYPLGALVQCIGEVSHYDEQLSMASVSVRVSRDLSVLDLEFYQKAVQYRRQFDQTTL